MAKYNFIKCIVFSAIIINLPSWPILVYIEVMRSKQKNEGRPCQVAIKMRIPIYRQLSNPLNIEYVRFISKWPIKPMIIDDIFLKNDERLLNVQLKKCNAGENFVNDLTSSNYNLKSENVPDAWLHILDFNYGVHRCAILGSFINHVDMTGVRGQGGEGFTKCTFYYKSLI